MILGLTLFAKVPQGSSFLPLSLLCRALSSEFENILDCLILVTHWVLTNMKVSLIFMFLGFGEGTSAHIKALTF